MGWLRPRFTKDNGYKSAKYRLPVSDDGNQRPIWGKTKPLLSMVATSLVWVTLHSESP